MVWRHRSHDLGEFVMTDLEERVSLVVNQLEKEAQLLREKGWESLAKQVDRKRQRIIRRNKKRQGLS